MEDQTNEETTQQEAQETTQPEAAKDATGQTFDPLIHAIQKDGSPWTMPSGKYRAARGKGTRTKTRRKSRVSKLALTPEQTERAEQAKAENHLHKLENETAKAAKDLQAKNRRKLALLLTGVTENIGVALAGEKEGRLRGNSKAVPLTPLDERAAMLESFEGLLESNPKLEEAVPSWAPCALFVGIYASRIAASKDEQNISVWTKIKALSSYTVTWFKGWWSGRKAAPIDVTPKKPDSEE